MRTSSSSVVGLSVSAVDGFRGAVIGVPEGGGEGDADGDEARWREEMEEGRLGGVLGEEVVDIFSPFPSSWVGMGCWRFGDGVGDLGVDGRYWRSDNGEVYLGGEKIVGI